MEVMRAEAEWQRAGAYSVRIEGMNRQHHISLREEFDEHDCEGTKYILMTDILSRLAGFTITEMIRSRLAELLSSLITEGKNWASWS